MLAAGILLTIISISYLLFPTIAVSRVSYLLCRTPQLSDISAVIQDAQEIMEILRPEWEILVENVTDQCSDQILDSVKSSMEDKNTAAVVATIPPDQCPFAENLAKKYEKTLVTISCPQVDGRKIITIGPEHEITASVMLEIFKHFHWKSVSIITFEVGWWPNLALRLESTLKGSGVNVRYQFVLNPEASEALIKRTLQQLKQAPSRAIVLCMSPESELSKKVILIMDKLQMARLPGTSVIFINLEIPYYVRILGKILSSLSANFRKAALLLTTTCYSSNYENFNSSSNETLQIQQNIWCLLKTSINALNITYNDKNSTSDSNRYVLMDWMNDTYLKNNKLVNKTDLPNDLNATNIGKWRSIIMLDWAKKYTTGMKIPIKIDPLIQRSRDWPRLKNMLSSMMYGEETLYCDEEFCNNDQEFGILPNTIKLAAVSICSAISIIVLVSAAILIRRQYLKRQMSKGPCKILLTAADFVFPHVPEGRRVDEGIETMLCCWLQQLQEFGGPEVDKPDLLKGSVGSIHSLHSLRPVLSDPRARYNGDLVQLKLLRTQSGSFELKSKAMDILMNLHGLRHENLNALIGCLMEPTRPALVWEWCTRGSLEDVLIQDEIKLDWSFRLSLLTDLVRGLRYLHSVPHRVHGNLTSRNCVIDARWVLKLTDYCLPSFYVSQNLTPARKTARGLLWTAPELLRNESLRLQGTQPGDVYSFSIIMQEVVVRGEPFCMLSLSPEEIIEKVKKPPPLIRPSVSKGAAPPEAINIMRQCWAEQADMRPDMNAVYDLFKTLNQGRKVNFVDTMFQMLEKYSNNLEDLIRERTEQLDMEKKKTEQLLNRMLPSPVAEKLKLGMPVDPEEFSEVTIYFSDIVGFTTISAYSTPFEVVDLLNDLYTCFDATINAYNVYKVETIGDAYMVVGGLPLQIPDHAEQVATMALDLLHQSGKFKIRHLPNTPLRLRIGLHTGPCCAGVVGLTMPRYCLFGDTVNTASRMESSGSAWRIHISSDTKEKLGDSKGYELEYRGEIDIKGKGKMHTYWLLGKQGFNKELPSPPQIGLDEELIIYGRSGLKSSGNTPDKSEDESADTEVTEDKKPKIQKRRLVCQLSLDPSILIEGQDRKLRRSWSAKRQMTFDAQGSQDEEDLSKSAPDSKPGNPREMSSTLSSSDLNIDVLGVSFVNIPKGNQRRIPSVIENDLSSAYNHYRCLSPGSGTNQRNPQSRFLKRQFSMDRDEVQASDPSKSHTSARLYKQNSAGAAHDLERIEEIPLQKSNNVYRHRVDLPTFSSHSVSAESLN